MKKIKSELESIQEKLESKIDERDAIMDNRSEKWQESEKAEIYQLMTEILTETMDTIATAIESIEEFLEQ